MFSSLREKAWATALAVGGLLLVGTAAAQADEAKTKSGDHRPAARVSGPSTEKGERGRRHTAAESRRPEDGRRHAAAEARRPAPPRTQADRGQHKGKEGKAAEASPEKSRGHWGKGEWAQREGHGRRRVFPLVGKREVCTRQPRELSWLPRRSQWAQHRGHGGRESSHWSGREKFARASHGRSWLPGRKPMGSAPGPSERREVRPSSGQHALETWSRRPALGRRRSVRLPRTLVFWPASRQ